MTTSAGKKAKLASRVGLLLARSAILASRMLASETRVLAIFRWLPRAEPRQWQGVSIPELANGIGGRVAEVVEAFLGLWARDAVQLRKWSDQARNWVEYADGQEGQFFYQGTFQARVTPSGREYLETLKQKEREERAAEIRDGKGPVVFISCGQWSDEERDLGQRVSQLVEQMTGCRAYFAENQNSLEGLKDNIFRALGEAAGFVGIMHDRGTVSRPDGQHNRGSVWVEQEIAIVAFLTQMQEREAFPVAVYVERGIRREGVREQLLLHEVEFDKADEVLADLERRIKDGRFHPSRGPVGADLRPGSAAAN